MLLIKHFQFLIFHICLVIHIKNSFSQLLSMYDKYRNVIYCR